MCMHCREQQSTSSPITTALTALLRLLAPMTFIVLTVSLLAPLCGFTVSYASCIAQIGLMFHLYSCWRACFTAILYCR